MSDDGGIPTGPGAGARPGYLPTVTSTPDWAAMAERNEREAKRRRTLRIGGGVLGVVLVGGLTAGLLAAGGGGSPERPEPATTVAGSPVPSELLPVGPSELPSPSTSPSASASPSASGSPSAPGDPSASAKAPSTAAKPSGKAGTAPPPSAGGQPVTTAPPPPAPPAPPSRLEDRGGRHPVALSGGPLVGPVDGRTALQLHGHAATYGQTAGTVVDTNASFTVSALVRNDAATGGRAVVSQGDGAYHSFHLGRDYWGGHNQWVFKVQQAAGGSDSTTLQAFSKENATVGRWTVLTGVYDAGTKTIHLYVDGQLAQSTKISGIWNAGGPLQIGRTRYKSTWTDPWDGAIANVQLWNRALTADQARRLGTSGGVDAGTGAYAAWLLP